MAGPTKADLLEFNTALNQAFEHTQTELAMVQRQLDDILYLNLNELPNREEYAVLPSAKKREIIKRLRILRQENPLAKQAMKLAMRFTFGKGITFVIRHHESRKVINQFWYDPENMAVLTSHLSMRDRFDELLTDGEKFMVMFKSTTAPYVKLGEIPMEEVVDVISHPENRFIPLYYKRRYYELKYNASGNNGEGEWERIGLNGSKDKPIIKYYRDYRVTDEMLDDIGNKVAIPDSMVEEDAYVKHRLVNPLWTKQGRRGISELFASREWFRVFKEFMEDRGAINAAANTFSYVRKVKGGAASVAAIRGKVGSMTVGNDEPGLLRRMTRPVAGAFYDINEAMDVSALRADTGAVDAKEDARMLLMTGGAGVGTMLPYFGEGGDANLATAQAMELPMVKMFEDYQTEAKDDLNTICMFVLEIHYGQSLSDALSKQDNLLDDEGIGTPDPSRLIQGASEALGDIPVEPPPGGDVTEVPEIPEPDNMDDRFAISWQMPPIITQDVVKYMSAWAQLAQQVAPGNKVVKLAAIRGALTTMDVGDVEAMMDEVMAAEEVIDAEKKLKEAQMQAQFNEKEPPNGENGNGKGISGAPPPLGPDLKRIAEGKPPRVPATGGRMLNRTRGS